MSDKANKKKSFPHRESEPGSHVPDKDGRIDYGRDGETTYKD